MRALAHLIAVALVSAVGTAALAASTWSAAAGLASVPVAWWSTAQIAQAAIVLACGLGTAGCLWHLASAGLALTVLLQDALATADARGASAPVTSRSRAGTVLQRWGAPLVRRIATGAMIAGLTIAPAAAAAAVRFRVALEDIGTALKIAPTRARKARLPDVSVIERGGGGLHLRQQE